MIVPVPCSAVFIAVISLHAVITNKRGSKLVTAGTKRRHDLAEKHEQSLFCCTNHLGLCCSVVLNDEMEGEQHEHDVYAMESNVH